MWWPYVLYHFFMVSSIEHLGQLFSQPFGAWMALWQGSLKTICMSDVYITAVKLHLWSMQWNDFMVGVAGVTMPRGTVLRGHRIRIFKNHWTGGLSMIPQVTPWCRDKRPGVDKWQTLPSPSVYTKWTTATSQASAEVLVLCVCVVKQSLTYPRLVSNLPGSSLYLQSSGITDVCSLVYLVLEMEQHHWEKEMEMG